jgi:cupin fold WbuC family metalloprotein
MVIEFETDGKINDFLELNSELGNYGIDLMPGIYHTLIPLTESIIFEAKQGPFSPINFLDLAPWAPAEGSDGTLEYQKRLLEEIYSR